nr:MAG TPA: hypothetical protein [Caudoviricetes sp.]
MYVISMFDGGVPNDILYLGVFVVGVKLCNCYGCI